MKDLNNQEEIKKLDPKDVYGSTMKLYDQCRQVLKDLESKNYQNYDNIKNIVVCGMGGSAYGGHVALSLFKSELKVPLYVNNDYNLPEFADQSSLVILTSYSGSTEETISCANEALKRNCKIFGITSGGDLGSFLEANSLQSYLFNPLNNPSGQPRLGTGYIVLGTLLVLNKLGLVNLNAQEILEAIENLSKEKEEIVSKAKEISQGIVGKIPVVFTSGFLEGNAHILRNQINETAKSFSDFSVVPELNHHLMEGLKNPNDRKLTCLFIESDLFSDNIKKRLELTKDVVLKQNVGVFQYKSTSQTKLGQVLNVLSFGGFLSFYLAVLYDQDPSVIPWVDYFKEQLKK